MAHKSLREVRAELRRLLSLERFVAAKLEVQSSTGEVLFTVGGCWDRTAQRYVDRPVGARVFRLMESQDEIGRAIAKYIEQRLAGDDSRPALLLAIGNRGGGKTQVLALLIAALALALPRTWQIGISITQKQNREVKAGIAKVIDQAWVRKEVTDPRDSRTEFVTGATVLWLTSKNPKALRQALLSFEHVFINEGQDQSEKIFTNSISAVRSGGVVSIATNPPQEGSGDWIVHLDEGIRAGSRAGQRFEIKIEGNTAVSHPTVEKIGELLKMVNPEAYEADYLGLIKISGTVGYPGFTRLPRIDGPEGWKQGHIGTPPARPDVGEPLWKNVTREVTAQHTLAAFGEAIPFDFIGGSDFQADPGPCCAIGELYVTPWGDTVLYIREFIGTQGVEENLTLALTSRGYFPGPVDYDGNPAASLLLVGDATGARQNAEHRKRDPYSFTRLKTEGWKVLPPAFYGKKRTPWNPLISDSRKQMKACFLAGLILLSPACAEPQDGFPSLIDSFARAKVNSFGKFEKGKNAPYTHGPDDVRYLAWRFLPRGITPPTDGGGFDLETFDRLKKVRVLRGGR